MTIENGNYPVRFDIARDAAQSRLTNFPLGIGSFIRYILLVPHLIIVGLLGLVAYVLYFIATFAILFTGAYPRDMYDLVVTYTRWNARITAYALSLFDKYPPFAGNEDAAYPLSFTVDYPERSSRLLNFPILGVLIKGILLIPHYFIMAILVLLMLIVVFIAQFAILFTGSFPAGMHGFCVGVSRWSVRLSTYLYGLTDAYPPFSMK